MLIWTRTCADALHATYFAVIIYVTSPTSHPLILLLQTQTPFSAPFSCHFPTCSQNLLVDDATMCLKIADLGLGRAFSIPVKSYTHEVRVGLEFRALLYCCRQ